MDNKIENIFQKVFQTQKNNNENRTRTFNKIQLKLNYCNMKNEKEKNRTSFERA